MPVFGTRIISPDHHQIAANLRTMDFWAGVMRSYPKAAKDYFRLNGPDVEVKIDWEFLTTADDWNTKPTVWVPYPYWLALAAEHPNKVVKLPAESNGRDFNPGELYRTGMLSPYGKVWGELGTGSAHYTLADMTKYVTEVREVADVQKGPKLQRAWDDLAYTCCSDPRLGVLRSMSDLGGKGRDNNFTLHRVLLKNDGGYKFGQHCFECENTMIANLTHALAYLPPERAQIVKALMMRFVDAGTMLERWKGFNDQRLMFEDVQWFISRFMAGIWSYGHYTGDWTMVKDRWPLVKVEFASLCKEMAWENMRSAGSEESNLLYQGAIGYARTAKAVEDSAEYLYGTYYATRQLALQQAMWMTIDPQPKGHQSNSWYASTPQKVRMDDAAAKPRRPAMFYWWMMAQPEYEAFNNGMEWHAGVLSPFTYPYFPEIMRFQTERNEPLVKYYLGKWDESFPDWYKRNIGGWHEYFGAPEFFASRGWMCDYTHESAEEMMDKYLQSYWGTKTPAGGGYEFNNRGWTSLPSALTAILEASGKRQWVTYY